jgi:hypothetical protein
MAIYLWARSHKRGFFSVVERRCRRLACFLGLRLQKKPFSVIIGDFISFMGFLFPSQNTRFILLLAFALFPAIDSTLAKRFWASDSRCITSLLNNNSVSYVMETETNQKNFPEKPAKHRKNERY